ncbi:hypothetical protein HETIRDRAFT_476703, partial [Heterobasidion irregulare TC 32-1]
MAIKRKFDSDSVEVGRQTKQIRCIPFPAYEPDFDVEMSDASSSDNELMPAQQFHSRHDSTASTNSDASLTHPSMSSSLFRYSRSVYSYIQPLTDRYPSFNIYPTPFFGGPGGTVDTDSHNYSRYATPPPQAPAKPVGLFEPRNSFAHH